LQKIVAGFEIEIKFNRVNQELDRLHGSVVLPGKLHQRMPGKKVR
jgi:hypothetical protein